MTETEEAVTRVESVFLQAHDALEAAREKMRGAVEPDDRELFNKVNSALYAVRARPDILTALERAERERDEARAASRELPEPTPEWEAKAQAFRAASRAEHPVEPEETLNMLRTWTADCQPANEHGQVSFARAMLESAEDVLEALLSRAQSAEAALAALKAEVVEVVGALEPHLDAIVCYASSMDEHEPNRLAFNARDLLAKLKGEE